jgi:hypothetical protein
MLTERYKTLKAKIRNETKKYSSIIASREDNQLSPGTFDDDDNFKIAPTVRTNLFMLTLFTRINDVGIPYGPPVNYRSATADNLLDQTKFPQSLVDVAYSESDINIFAGNPMQVLFYKEKKLKTG